jgi:hypothetical protein
MKRISSVVLSVVCVLAAGCGAQNLDSPNDNTHQDVPNLSPDGGVVRGHWEVPVGTGDSALSSSMAANSPTIPITGVVSPNVTFTLSTSSFSTPTNIAGVASYGTLKVTDLSDNNLRVCGSNGKSKCLAAAIRIYSTGGGAGLWNSDEGGLPILTGSATVGYTQSAPTFLKAIAVASNMKVVKLSSFVSGSTLDIPISVDFTDAAAGTYSATLVVEYVLY